MFIARPLVVLGLGAMAVMATAAWPTGASAQQIFRIVGSDGRVTFSDRPPADGAAEAAAPRLGPTAGSAGGDTAVLPFELRQAAASYPVTLYTGPGCPPCAAARDMLAARGIPFSEKTVSTNEDIEALRRLAGAPTLPALSIGNQQLRGYSELEWAQYLDAAGYPQTSQLPANFQRAPAAPLVAVVPAKPVAKPQPATASAPPAPPPPPAAPYSNGGIRF